MLRVSRQGGRKASSSSQKVTTHLGVWVERCRMQCNLFSWMRGKKVISDSTARSISGEGEEEDGARLAVSMTDENLFLSKEKSSHHGSVSSFSRQAHKADHQNRSADPYLACPFPDPQVQPSLARFCELSATETSLCSSRLFPLVFRSCQPKFSTAKRKTLLFHRGQNRLMFFGAPRQPPASLVGLVVFFGLETTLDWLGYWGLFAFLPSSSRIAPDSVPRTVMQ